MNNLFKWKFSFVKGLMLTGLSITLASCSPGASGNQELSAKDLDQYQRKLALRLQNPIRRSKLIAKVLGSTETAERHSFLKFHVFGFEGDGNLIPFFTMNNYVVQKWSPGDDGNFEVEHYEVAYYAKFDTNEAINSWENPLTGEVLDLPHFVLGPVPRFYGPTQPETSESFASDPLNITMIGDRVFIPTLTSFAVDNILSPAEWGPYSNGPKIYWDSMMVYSADVEDVFDETKTHVDAEIHMQNLISWAPYLKVGQHPGRTMVRAYGKHISGYDDLPKDIRANLEKYTPEIFDIEGWTDMRMDSIELAATLKESRENGSLDIDQPDYKPYEIIPVDERGQ